MSWLDSCQGDYSMPSLMFAASSSLLKLATSKKHQLIRQECSSVMGHIQEQAKRNHEAAKASGTAVYVDTDANKYFLVLKLACDTGVSKLMCLALDAMQKLMSYGYLQGNQLADPRVYPNPNPHLAGLSAQNLSEMQQKIASIVSEGLQGPESPAASSGDLSLPTLTGLASTSVLSAAGSDGRLIAVIINTLYECAQYKDQQVQLLVLKCIVTTVTSPVCSVHGWSLLQAIAACYQIYLANPAHANNAGEEINRVTAKATLNQIVNLVFTRMEHAAHQLKQMNASLKINQTSQTQQLAASLSAAAPTPSSSSSASGDTLSVPGVSSNNNPTLSPTPSPDPVNSPTSEHSAEQAAAAAAAAILPGRRGFCVVCNKAANNFCLTTKESVCSVECKRQNLAKKDPEEKITRQLIRASMVTLELNQNDAYYVLRSLCKLAIKILPPTASTDKNDANSMGVDSKILSLQLLLSILSNAGPTFRTTKHFIATVKGDVVNVILRNSAASSIETIFALSSSMFVSMVCFFKPYLHAVIGPVLDSIYLPYIASPNSTFEHKFISLTVLHKIAQDPQTLVELFINYDCDTGSLGNTFQKIATSLEKVCRSRFVSENWLSSQEESRLRLLALEGLVDTIKSLLTWTKRAQANILAKKEASEAAAAALAQDGYESDPEESVAELSTSNTSGTGRSKIRNSVMVGSATTSPSAASSSLSSSSSSKGDAESSFSMHQFHALRAQKQKLDTGILKFNMKPKKGLAYLESHGVLHADNPVEIAEFFLHNQSALDKVQVGEFMGDENELHKQVLYAYTERLDFHHLPFDDAIRKFLQGFWLPGEAQKIDRMMEKFASQYHMHNPGIFSSADTAYVLAYSVIMLNTDAHSSQVKNRMTREEFFKNNRAIDDGKDVDPAFLGQIYDRITTNEIKMKNDASHHRHGAKGELKREARINMFLAESQELVQKTQAYLESYTKKHEAELRAQENGAAAAASSSTIDVHDPSKRRLSVELEESKIFYQASESDMEAVRPMFEILWYPSLATFSVLLEENECKVDDPNLYANTSSNSSSNVNHNVRIIELCLDGYRHSIRLSSVLGIETARLAFVTSLRKFTLLGSAREMKWMKNIEAIKMLLLIAHTEGNHLKESWMDVLQCISELERLHLFASSRPIADVFQSSPIRTRESDSLNSMHINKIDASSIDRVFTGSAHLDSDAIVDFVKALRMVSEQELSNIHAPRVFSLQMIVESTYYNMSRIRVVWSKIWSVLSQFFVKAGCHPNLNVSMYAIDSLRQLSMKFLERIELAHYQFQKQFFKPFELIMINNSSNETRELIVQCMKQMVASRVNNIKSGWKGVFVVIHTAASQTYQPLVVAGFDLLSNIMDKHFDLLTSTTDTMDDCVNCLVAFGCNNFNTISLKAIYYINQCCDHLGAQQAARREKLVAKLAQEQGADGTALDGLSTPQRSRGASTVNENGSSSSSPGSPLPHSVDSDELDVGLLSPGGSNSAANGSSSSDNSNMQQDLKIWFLALTGLSRMVLDHRLEVRSRALLALFKILAGHGALFSGSTWRAVFCGVLFPIFDDVRHTGDVNRSANKRLPGSVAGSEANTPIAEVNGTNAGLKAWSNTAAPTHHSAWRNPNNWSWPAAASGNPRLPVQQQHHHVGGLKPVSAAAQVSMNGAPTAASGNAPKTMPTLPPRAPSAPPTSAAPTPAAAAGGVPTNVPPRPPSAIPPAAPPRPPQVQAARAAAANPPSSVSVENSWLSTTCFSALSTLVDLFDHFYAHVSFMLADMLSLINSCISQENEELARIGIRCLIQLLNKVGPKLSINAWWICLESLAEIVQRTMPLELMSHKLRVILGLVENEGVGAAAVAAAAAAAVEDNITETDSKHSSRAGSRRNSGSAAAAITPSPSPAQAVVTSATSAIPGAANLVSSPVPVDSSATEPASSLVPPVEVTGSSSPLTVNVPSPSPGAPIIVTTAPPTPTASSGSKSGTSPAPAPSLPPLPPPTAGSTPPLPFSSSSIVGKFRVQLQLLEALFQVCDAFFPIKAVEQAREKGVFMPNNSQKKASTDEKVGEIDFLSNGEPKINAEDVTLSSTDEVTLGALTCEQLFFGLDLLSSSLSFARTFNLDLNLRRKLYSFGLQTEQTLLGRLPQLFLQETRATRLYMHLLFRMIREGGAGESEAHEAGSMDGAKWLKLTENGTVEWKEETTSSGATPVLSSYQSYVQLSEGRCISIALRFLSDYVSKSVSGQLVSLEFSEELLCSFIDNLHKIGHVSPKRFNNYLSIFYQSLVQLICFGKDNIRAHLGLLFQQALPALLPFQTITPFPLIPINAVAIPVPAYLAPATADNSNAHKSEQ